MDDKVSLNLILQHLLDVIEEHSARMDKIMIHCVQKNDCQKTHDAVMALNEELKEQLAGIKKNMGETSHTVTLIDERFKTHIDRHDKRFRMVGVIAGIIGLILAIFGLWEKYLSKMFK